ncbi:MAG: hypothetical protein A2498_03720 [Lentisphaerae bacterium RIFOXYC12_FULL_60_16]|nr:MAG: hypothetical protein A2498_03720 [Lentisphaerae bacterium RIFOXYC12_FULL_60_16]OGV86008.1 MAG: hypothetical protein A2340_08520 [Lentisphaerae bacterium RIFOXYB12_FULL_60_10]
MMKQKARIRIGLIGAGWMGRHHAGNIMRNPDAELAGVADVNEVNIAHLRQDAGWDGPVYKDHQSLLESAVDAVVIASPNSHHAAMCLDAAHAGKHLYCEKPMAITLEDCRRIRDAVRKARVKYLIGYHRRLNPLYQYAHQLVREGRLGDVFMVESDYLHHIPGDWDIWSWLGKEGVAGSLFHAGSGHNVDLIRFFGGDIAEVSCMKGTFLPRKQQVETEDTALAMFRFASGAVGKVQFCVGPILPFQFNLRLYGTRGSVLNNRVWLDSIPKFADPGHERDCVELPASWVPDNVQGGISEPWGKLMDHFVDMMVREVPCLNDVDSAFQTSAACFAAMEAAKRNTVINLKEMMQ